MIPFANNSAVFVYKIFRRTIFYNSIRYRIFRKLIKIKILDTKMSRSQIFEIRAIKSTINIGASKNFIIQTILINIIVDF